MFRENALQNQRAGQKMRYIKRSRVAFDDAKGNELQRIRFLMSKNAFLLNFWSAVLSFCSLVFGERSRDCATLNVKHMTCRLFSVTDMSSRKESSDNLRIE